MNTIAVPGFRHGACEYHGNVVTVLTYLDGVGCVVSDRENVKS